MRCEQRARVRDRPSRCLVHGHNVFSAKEPAMVLFRCESELCRALSQLCAPPVRRLKHVFGPHILDLWRGNGGLQNVPRE
jgi:hypothetical protein